MKIMAASKGDRKQNVTIRLDRKTIRSAEMLAARRSTSLSALLACQIQRLAADDETYELSKQRAMALLDRGFHLGGKIRVSRDKLHER